MEGGREKGRERDKRKVRMKTKHAVGKWVTGLKTPSLLNESVYKSQLLQYSCYV